MLIKQELNELANEKEYIKVFNYFHDEYTELLKTFLVRHDVKVEDSDCLINYIVKTRAFMPQYTTYTVPISKAMYNENMPEEIKYDLLINSYDTIKKIFSE